MHGLLLLSIHSAARAPPLSFYSFSDYCWAIQQEQAHCYFLSVGYDISVRSLPVIHAHLVDWMVVSIFFFSSH